MTSLFGVNLLRSVARLMFWNLNLGFCNLVFFFCFFLIFALSLLARRIYFIDAFRKGE